MEKGKILSWMKQLISSERKWGHHIKHQLACSGYQGTMSLIGMPSLYWVQQVKGLAPGLLLANRNPKMVSNLTQKEYTAFWAPCISVIGPPHLSAKNTQFCLEGSGRTWTFIWRNCSVLSHLLCLYQPHGQCQFLACWGLLFSSAKGHESCCFT